MSKALPVKVVTESEGGSLYVAAPKIYARSVAGRFQRLRTIAVFWLLGMYYLAPWLQWDARQAVLFDLPARKFYFLGLVFWPQDFMLLSWLLIIAGFSLFFFTALAGRLWCGYACPQTVWSEVFMWVEAKLEGDRNHRIKLDAAPWTREKVLRKGGKHVLWLLLALWTGFTFVGFFTPIHALASDVLSLSVSGWALFWLLFYSLATWGNAGFLREQVCKYMCPYARFQSAMFDHDTLLISYRSERGEPRGSRKKSADPKLLGLGACIDCTICVQVCPTGIDIRNGLQYECIACGACVDACDEVMDKMGYPRGLVGYTTEHALEQKPTRVLRPRILVYGGLLVLMLSLFSYVVTHRERLIVDVLRDRNALYRVAPDGSIENVYTFKLVNKEPQAHSYKIALIDAGQIALRAPEQRLDVGPEQVGSFPITLYAAPAAVKGKRDIQLQITALDAPEIQYLQSSRFFAPES